MSNWTPEQVITAIMTFGLSVLALVAWIGLLSLFLK